MTNINDVIIEGVIVHKFVTPQIAILTINTGNATPTRNNPKILFFGEHIKDIEENYEVKDHVLVTGNIQSSKRKSNVPNQNMVSIFGESIQKSQTIIEKEYGVVPDVAKFVYQNKIKVAGIITHIIKEYDNLVRIRVSVQKNGRQSFVNLVYYTDFPQKVFDKFTSGDNICAIGCVQTTKKTKDGETKHFENYVATELTKLENK